MASRKPFQQAVKDFAEKIGADVKDVTRLVALNVANDIVLGTPRDKGRAAASWNVSYGKVDSSVREEGEYSLGGSLAAVSQTLSQVPDGDELAIYISNNLEYIVPLEKGHSKQAPAGMVAIAMRRAREYLRSAANSKRRG